MRSVNYFRVNLSTSAFHAGGLLREKGRFENDDDDEDDDDDDEDDDNDDNKTRHEYNASHGVTVAHHRRAHARAGAASSCAAVHGWR